MRFAISTLLVGLSVTTLAQSITPQPYTRFIAGTVAQDLAATPKGGWVYIVGSTTDRNYPVTADALDRTCGTDGLCNEFQGRFGIERLADIVLTVVDAAGEIRYSTFLGGAGRDDNPRIALSRDGTLWLAGNTTAAGFEHLAGGCGGSLVVTRFEWTLHRAEQQVCLDLPALADIALDPDGTLWVLGTTGVQVPTVNALQPNLAGQQDMFVAHLSPSQSAPFYSTYIGGDRLDTGAALALTPAGDVAIVGATTSTNFPLVRAARMTPPSAAQRDATVLVLDRSGRLLEFSTLWGGVFDDSAADVSVAANGEVVVTGTTASADLPVTPGAADTVCDAGSNPGGCRDAFVTKFSALGQLHASTFFGGSQLDSGRALSLRANGQVLLLGSTQSPDFPLVGGHGFQRWRPGPNFEHSFVATFDVDLTRVTRAVFVGDEQVLPNVPRFTVQGGFAYVAGQLGAVTGPGFGNYLGAQPVP